MWAVLLNQQPFREPEDPLPFGPSSWDPWQWLGLATYVALFLVFLFLIYRLSRPEVPSEIAADDAAGPGERERGDDAVN